MLAALTPPMVLMAAAMAATPGFGTGAARAGGRALERGAMALVFELPATVGVGAVAGAAEVAATIGARFTLEFMETLIEVPATVPWRGATELGELAVLEGLTVLVYFVGLVGSARTTTMSSSESKLVGKEGARKVQIREGHMTLLNNQPSSSRMNRMCSRRAGAGMSKWK